MERLLRIAAAVLVLAGGAVHLQLWNDGYRGIPRIGPSFMANVIISVALAVAIVIFRDRRIALAGILFSLAALGALVMSRTTGIFGFTEKAWTTSVVQAAAAEVGAVILLIFLFGMESRKSRTTAIPRAAAVGTA